MSGLLFSVALEGDTKLIARMESWPTSVQVALYQKVSFFVLKLEAYIKNSKLNGQVLKRVSGALARSITSKVEQTAMTVIGIVFSAGDVKYAAIQEYGGTTLAHIIRPKTASVLAFGNPKIYAAYVNHPGSHIPEHSYMRSALNDMSQEISIGLKQAAVEGLMKGAR